MKSELSSIVNDSSLLRSRLSRAISDAEISRVFEWYEAIYSSYNELYFEEQISKYYKLISYLRKLKLTKLLRKYGIPTVIDLGCGTSNLALYLGSIINTSILYIGLDISPKQLSIAYKRKLTENNVLIELIAGDITRPPLREDVKPYLIALISVLRCSYDYEAIINYFRYVFKPTVFMYSILCSSKEVLNEVISKLSKNALCLNHLSYEILCIEVRGDEGI